MQGMANRYNALVLTSGSLRSLEALLDNRYQLHAVNSVEDAIGSISGLDAKIILLDLVNIGPKAGIAACRALKDDNRSAETPLVVLADSETLKHRMSAYDAGCDDYLSHADIDELKPRLDRVLFNKVANDQLRMQLRQANEMAFIAMSDTSDLGVNIQFLLDVNQCDNLDVLGMRMFQALQSYGISCSLQMRGRYAIKNMEANGMSKDLESALLMECRDKGRYVDFGKRSIMNYGGVSLLVKNMPVDDPKKYGAIKDNVFSLLQGADARIQALDNLYSLELERALVTRMASQMRHVMSTTDESYQRVMRQIAAVVEAMAEGVEHSVQFLGLDEYQERTIQDIMERGISETTRVFNDGMRTDEGLELLLHRIDSVFTADSVDTAEVASLLQSI
jgi:CheY-like chemotaxis protein